MASPDGNKSTKCECTTCILLSRELRSAVMADRPILHQNIATLLAKLDDPDADLRFMSLNDLFGILSSPASSFLSGESQLCGRLTDALLKALTDQHGEVQNQALKCLAPLALRLPTEALVLLFEDLTEMTVAENTDTSVPNTALRGILDTLPHPQTGQAPPSGVQTAYSAISHVLIPRLTGPIRTLSGRPSSLVRGMVEKDPLKGFSTDAIDVLIKVVTCFGPLLKESEMTAMEDSMMAILQSDTAGTVITKRAQAAISAMVIQFSDNQLNALVERLAGILSSNSISIPHRRNLIALLGTMARNAPTRMGPHVNRLVPFVFAALGMDVSQQGK